ncbi:MAG: hypothetical protein QM714_07910 [Nocardioides sp.]|uniref:hypothetical protein n=1 Tax=Nocardioides sp. TaxID=35761 RepID=UPI0039E24148
MSDSAADPELAEVEASGRAMRRPAWVNRMIWLAVAAVITVLTVRLVGRVDWPAVGRALSHLTWWQPFVLLAVLLTRQVMNALPLKIYIPGVTIYRATINDLGAMLMSLFAPPPSDIALRTAMFSSWGISTSTGLAGAVMNTLTFYVVRFGVPVLGFVLLLVTGQPAGLRYLEILSIAIAVAIFVGIVLVIRSEALARTVGTRSALVVRKVRSSVKPESWAEACVRFRAETALRFRQGFPRSMLALVGMVVADLTLLVCCLRFVGVSAADVSLLEIAIAYLFAYPFTVFPFAGIGVVDAILLAALVGSGGQGIEAAAVAALGVWRIFTIGGPVLLGVIAVAIWRRSLGDKQHATAG